MTTHKKLLYTTIRIDAYTIKQFIRNEENFYDKELEDKLEILIQEINKHLEDE